MNNDYLLNAIEVDNFYSFIGYASCILLMIIGIIIIIKSKNNPKNLKDDKTKNNNIDKLINKDKKEKEEKIFNPDSIFKKIPTFSNKTFFENIENHLKQENEEIKIIKKEIIDFKDETDKYIIISLFKTKENENEKNIIITSEKYKDNYIEITNCPTCGGKIKDTTITRCKYCSTPLPKKKNKTEWEIVKTKKED